MRGGVRLCDSSQFLRDSDALRELTGQAPKPLLAILGPFNAGKSTLLNGLLGLQLSPVGIIPTTSQPIYFDYGSSFKATVSKRHQDRVFYQPGELYSFLARNDVSDRKVSIKVPVPILKKCRFLDSPGIDSPGIEPLSIIKLAGKEADKVIYLFHQRGIDEGSRQFLYRLASVWKTKNPNDISFWLNCNQGTSDGTSLETTRTTLREIFLRPIRIYTINTLAEENIETFRIYLEVQLAKNHLAQAHQMLRKADANIPRKLKKVNSIKDEALFLAEFWDIRRAVQTILEAGHLIHTAPSVAKELDRRLTLMNSANLIAKEKKAEGTAYHSRRRTIRDNKLALLNIIEQLNQDPIVKTAIDQVKLISLSNLIVSKHFVVTVTGNFSTGKSTFINALLKDNLLPAADGPTTPVVTRIYHGSTKTATVHIPLQTTLQVYEQIGGKAVLNKAVLEVFERLSVGDGSDIALLEAFIGGNFKIVGRQKIAPLLKETRELFSAGAFARTAHKVQPSIYKGIPIRRLRSSRIPQKIRLTFRNPGEREFDISETLGLQRFWDTLAAGCPLEVSEVTIQCPSQILEHVVFVDTPGLDWLQKYHQQNIADNIENSDVCLVFLNGKHILSSLERNKFDGLFWSTNTGKNKTAKKDENIFYVISFADTLTPQQRVSVYSYVKDYLKKLNQGKVGKETRPKIFMISCLKGLTGTESGISSLLKNLEEVLLKNPGRQFYLNRLRDIYHILEEASQKINHMFQSNRTGYSERKGLLAAQQGLREYRRQIKKLQKSIYVTGRLVVGGKRKAFR